MSSSERRLGSPRLHLRVTGSTNDIARELAASGAPDGALVTAEEQTLGRGRQGRRWSAPARSSLLMSLVLRQWPPLLPLIAPVAVCDVVGEGAYVKWPNDVVVAGDAGAGAGAAGRGAAGAGAFAGAASVDAGAPLRKLAGILIEGRPQEGWLVLGIGLNVSVSLEDMPAELRETAASMGLPREAIEEILSKLLRALETRLSEPPQQTLAAWRSLDALKGRPVSWSGGEGLAGGVDDGGRLVVEQADGSVAALDSGEVTLVRAAA